MSARKYLLALGKRIAPVVETALDEGAELLGKVREEAEAFGADFAKSYKDCKTTANWC